MTEHNLIVWTLVPHRLLYLRGVFFSQFLVRCVRWGGVCYTEGMGGGVGGVLGRQMDWTGHHAEHQSRCSTCTITLFTNEGM